MLLLSTGTAVADPCKYDKFLVLLHGSSPSHSVHALSSQYRSKTLCSFPKLFPERAAIPSECVFTGSSD